MISNIPRGEPFVVEVTSGTVHRARYSDAFSAMAGYVAAKSNYPHSTVKLIAKFTLINPQNKRLGYSYGTNVVAYSYPKCVRGKFNGKYREVWNLSIEDFYKLDTK